MTILPNSTGGWGRPRRRGDAAGRSLAGVRFQYQSPLHASTRSEVGRSPGHFSRHILGITVAATFLLAVPIGAGLAAPPRAPTPVSRNAAVVPVRLGPLWLDEANGFELRPPAGCRALGSRGADLASFANQASRWGIIVHRSRLAHRTKLASLVQAVINSARREFQAVSVLRSRRLSVCGHPAQELVLRLQPTSNRAPLALLRQQLLVQIRPNDYYTLTFFSPADQRTRVRAIFSAVRKTFRILNRGNIERRRLAGVQAGKQWLKKQSVRRLLAHLGTLPQLFRVRLHHHEIGYVRMGAYAGTQAGYRGVFFSANSLTFLPQGVDIVTQSLRFWAFHRQPKNPGPPVHYSAWVGAVQTMWPIHNPRTIALRQERMVIDPRTKKLHIIHIHIPWPDMHVRWTREIGIQQGGFFPKRFVRGKPSRELVWRYRIKVARNRDHVEAGQSQKPLKFSVPAGMPAVLSPVLEYLWPRLVDLKKRRTMAFVVFDSGASRLALRVVRVLGRQEIQLDGRRVRAYHLVDQLYPGVTQLWVNSKGALLKVRASDDSVWLPTTARAMARRWRERLQKLYRKNP